MARPGMVRHRLLGLLIALLVMTPCGVLASAAGLQASTEPQDALHQVGSGDNLHLIAGYYYGDARQWEQIWRANRRQVPNPNVIERGMLLLIPATTVPDEPYADFVARVRRQAARAGSSVAPDNRRQSQ